MIDGELLKVLCCPESRQRVAPADAGLIESLNRQITAGTLRNRAGDTVTEPIDGGLIREDRKFLYPIRHDIPVMLIDEAIPVMTG
jgi:uncharacterized protein YbaR (Trm112 family)